MKHIITAFIVLITFTSSLIAQQNDKYFEQGLTKLSNNDFNGSIELFTKSISLKATNAAYYNRAKAYREIENYTAALKDLTQILLSEPTNEDALELKTLIYYLQDDYKLMSTSISKNLKNGIDTKHNSRFYLAIAYYELGKADSSAILLELHLKQKPNDVDALYYRSNLSMDKMDFDSSLADLNKVLQLDSNYKDAYFSRGFIKSLKSLYSQALPDLDKAENLGFEELLYLYELRGDAYKELGDSLKAASEYDKAIKDAEKPDIELLTKRAKLAYYQLDDNQTAYDLLTKVIQESKEFTPDVYLVRACAARELKKLEQSETDFVKYNQLSPKSRAYYIQWALLKVEQQDWKKVIELANEYLKIQKITGFARSTGQTLIGRALYEQKSFIEASNILQEAFKSDDENPDAHFWIGKVLIELKQSEKACEHFVKAYEMGLTKAKDELINLCDYTEESFDEEE